MSSSLNVSAVSAAPPAPAPGPPPAPKAQAAGSAQASTAQPTLIQLTEEPSYLLSQQAQAGNQQAAQVLAQEQAATSQAGTTGINIVA
jgi:hypothetical protein